ncbi:MAG: hypothetical protein GY928_13895 [Colwellia sp.]|nr:hypothetical protein [Colwellia sp.]
MSVFFAVITFAESRHTFPELDEKDLYQNLNKQESAGAPKVNLTMYIFLIIGLIDKGGEREEDKVLQRHRTEIIKEFLVSNFSISDERLRVKVKEKSSDFVGSPFLVKRVEVLE